MSREDPQFKLRLPAELKARIDQLAAANHRSINAEIVARLTDSITPEESAVERAARLEQIREQVMPGMVEIMADLEAKVAQQIEQRAQEIASLRAQSRDLAIEATAIQKAAKGKRGD